MGRVGLAGSPFTFSARTRPPRSKRENAMAQTPIAEVAPRYVTCACTRTTGGSAPRPRSPIAHRGGPERLRAHSGRAPPRPRPRPSPPIPCGSARVPPLGWFCWKSRPLRSGPVRLSLISPLTLASNLPKLHGQNHVLCVFGEIFVSLLFLGDTTRW